MLDFIFALFRRRSLAGILAAHNRTILDLAAFSEDRAARITAKDEEIEALQEVREDLAIEQKQADAIRLKLKAIVS